MSIEPEVKKIAAMRWLLSLKAAYTVGRTTAFATEAARLQKEGTALLLLLKTWLGTEAAPNEYIAPAEPTCEDHARVVMEGNYVITYVTEDCVTVSYNGAVSASCCSAYDLAEAVALLQGDDEFGDTTGLILGLSTRIRDQRLTDFDRAAIAMISDLRAFYEGRMTGAELATDAINSAMEALTLPDDDIASLLTLFGWVAVKEGDEFRAYSKDGDVYTQRLTAFGWRDFVEALNTQFQINIGQSAGSIQERPQASKLKGGIRDRKNNHR